jgi:hypothetical protein
MSPPQLQQEAVNQVKKSLFLRGLQMQLDLGTIELAKNVTQTQY